MPCSYLRVENAWSSHHESKPRYVWMKHGPCVFRSCARNTHSLNEHHHRVRPFWYDMNWITTAEAEVKLNGFFFVTESSIKSCTDHTYTTTAFFFKGDWSQPTQLVWCHCVFRMHDTIFKHNKHSIAVFVVFGPEVRDLTRAQWALTCQAPSNYVWVWVGLGHISVYDKGRLLIHPSTSC